MEIKIESPHFVLSGELNEYILNKVSKLEYLNERLIRSEVCLKLDKSDKDDNKICEIIVLGPRKNLFATKRSITFEDAVTETIHAIKKQLRKKKTKARISREKLDTEVE